MKSLIFPGVLLTVFGNLIQAANPVDSSSFAHLRAAATNGTGWVEQEQCRYFNVQELYGMINGGAAEHEKQGLRSGIRVILSNGAKSLEIYFEDFGSPYRARGMVRRKERSSSAPQPIAQVTGPAMYDEVLGGCIVYLAKSDYFIQMTLTGYDSIVNAVRDAATLINVINPVITTNREMEHE
jgi:hypothetical protein